jgi:hypothetical protein
VNFGRERLRLVIELLYIFYFETRVAMTIIEINTINTNNEQIRLNNAAIAFMQRGCPTHSRDRQHPELRDDTARSIARLIESNAELQRANAILRDAD